MLRVGPTASSSHPYLIVFVNKIFKRFCYFLCCHLIACAAALVLWHASVWHYQSRQILLTQPTYVWPHFVWTGGAIEPECIDVHIAYSGVSCLNVGSKQHFAILI